MPGVRASVHPLDPSRFELLTFDCYGTLVDWESGIIDAVRSTTTGCEASDADILEAFSHAEHLVQGERYRSYREVLVLTRGRMGASLGSAATSVQRTAFADSVGGWPVFADTREALERLSGRYRLGIVSNVDDDLFARTLPSLGVDFDWVVTASQVGSYKPAPAHFAEMERRSGVPRERTLHVAQSLFHDIAPASELGYATVHVNRPTRGRGSGAAPAANAHPTATVPDMASVAELLARQPTCTK